MGNRRVHFAMLATLALLLALPATGRAVTPQIFHVTSADSGLRHIVAGPDGALWFTERKANKVGRITTGGQITEYAIPNNASGLDDTGPDEIVRGGDGALWFLADIGESVYRITTAGSYAQIYYDQLNNASNLAPSDTGGVWLMMAHGDGNDQDGDALLRVDPSGAVTAYRATHPNTLDAIALAPDGSAWYNNSGSDLNRVTDDGSQQNTPLASPSGTQEVSSIAFDRSGTPWFTEFTPATLTGAGCCGAIGSIVGGVAHISTLGSQAAVDGFEPHSLTLGPDGALWFAVWKTWSGARTGYDGIGRIDPSSGQVQLANLTPYRPDDIAFGSDGALWFVDNNANVVGRIPIGPSLFGTAPTPQAPAVSLTLPAARISKLRHTRSLPIVCNLAAAGRCSVTASLAAAAARPLGLKVPRGATAVALTQGASTLKGAGHARIQLVFSTRVLHALARAHRSLKLTLTATSTATGTTPRTSTRTLTLRP